MGWAAITLAFLASLIMAFDQAMVRAPNLSKKLGYRPLSGDWRFLPFGLFLLAGIFWAFGWLTQPSTNDELPSVHSLPNTRSEMSATVEGVPLDEIVGYFENHTTDAAYRYVQRYIGRAIVARGAVQDIATHGPPDERIGYLYLETALSDPMLTFRFDNGSEIANLQIGERVEVRCKFASISAGVIISFDDCRLTGGPLPAERPS
jgi:hypothetical protein